MHDPFTLFKILIVVLVVVYQGVQALRKKAKARTGPVPQAPSYEPEPARPERQDAVERIRTLVLGRATPPSAPVAVPSVPDVPAPAAVVSMNPAEPIRSLEPATTQGIPSLRDLVLAQVILSPPPGARGGRPARRSPLELRR